MVEELSPYEALLAAVEIAGSQSALARIAKISSTAVWKWVQSSKRVPAEFVLLVETGTGISRHYLRPDIYPRENPPTDNNGLGPEFDRVLFQQRAKLKGLAA